MQFSSACKRNFNKEYKNNCLRNNTHHQLKSTSRRFLQAARALIPCDVRVCAFQKSMLSKFGHDLPNSIATTSIFILS